MEPFRGQYPDTSYAPVFPPPPGSEPMGYAYSPHHQTPNTGIKHFFSSHAEPVYDSHNKSRRSWRWKLRNASSNFWLWEIFTCLITLAIAAVIGQQLKKLDGRSTHYWSWAWSPTSVLALGVTIAKAAMMVPVASAIGQLKWHRYKKVEKLDNLEKFDDASRGVLGSLRLLWELRCWHIASIGAIITICALSLDSLTQNAVRVALVPEYTFNDSYVHRTKQFAAVSAFSQRSRELPSSEMLPSLYFAISSGEAPNFVQDLAWCPSSNCSFGSYDSLAVDYQCVPSKVEQSGSDILHGGMRSSGFTLNPSEDIIVSNTTTDLPPAGTYKNLGPLISRWLVLANPSALRPAPQAMECAFYWTVKKYWSETVNGIFYERTLATYTNSTATGRAVEDIYITPGECWRNNESLPVTQKNCTSVVSYLSHRSLQAWFNLPDFAVRGFALNDTQKTDTKQYWRYTSIFMQSIMAHIVDANETAIAATVNATAASLSSAMTATLRQMAEVYSRTDGDTYGVSYGTTIRTPTIVYIIAWKYLIFPALIVAFSALFFVTTIISTWGEGGWKSSQLALIFHGLAENDMRSVGNLKEYADMRDVGKDMRVQLVETELGKKLVGRKGFGHI